MAQGVIVPVAKTLYLCDGTIGFPNQKTDVVGLFNSIRAPQYPHRQTFVIFAQLTGRLGQVPFVLEMHAGSSAHIVETSNVHTLRFPSRNRLIQLAYTAHDWTFAQPGRYVIELYCDGNWVADTPLEVN
ncbi:MAG TPA: hypothetical protein VFE62_20255 [Gemmataceae bacterium]|nr:hypothetical protein [Gemmataceae bacterium]